MSILDGKDESSQPIGSSQLKPHPSLQSQLNQTEPLQVPIITGLNIAALTTPQGVTVMFYNQVPDKNWGVNAPMHQVPIAGVNLPLAQAKDLMLMLMELVPRHEEQFGEIFTPYMHEKGLREQSTKQ